MSTTNPSSLTPELMVLKFNEFQNMFRTEMEKLVSERDSLKKAVEFLEITQISTESDKCSLEEKLGRSEGRCHELEKKIVEMEEKLQKLRSEKLDIEEKLGKSERRYEDANQSVEEFRRHRLRPRSNLKVKEKSATDVEENENANFPDFGENADFGLSTKGANHSVIMSRGCKLERIDVIKKKLRKENLEKLEQSCFGHLLKINKDQLKFQGQLMLHLLLHIDMGASNNERLVFKINNSTIVFGLHEFSLITGLDDLGTLEEVTTVSSSIHREVFHGRSGIQFKDIEEAFHNVSRYDKGGGELALKLAFLYFLYGTLLGSYSKKIDTRYVHLIEDLHKFKAFPWGRVAYEFLVSSILAARVRLDGLEVTSKTLLTLNVDGFTFALQIWAYEVMPCLATYCASRVNNLKEKTPPILRWHAIRTFHFNHLKKFFTPGDKEHPVLNGTEAFPVMENEIVKLGEQSTGVIPQASSPQQKKRKLLCKDKDQMPHACDEQSSPTDCCTVDSPGSSGLRMPAINPDLPIPELIKMINEVRNMLMQQEKSRRMDVDELRVGKMKSDKAAQHYEKRLEDLEANLEKCDAAADKEKQNVNVECDKLLKKETCMATCSRSLAHSGSEPAAFNIHDNEYKKPGVRGCSHASVMCSDVEVPRWKMTSGDYHVIVLSDSEDEVQDTWKITEYCRVDSKKRRPSPAAAGCDSESPLQKFNAATDHVHSADSDDKPCSYAYMNNLVATLEVKEEQQQQKMDV